MLSDVGKSPTATVQLARAPLHDGDVAQSQRAAGLEAGRPLSGFVVEDAVRARGVDGIQDARDLNDEEVYARHRPVGENLAGIAAARAAEKNSRLYGALTQDDRR